MSNCSSVWLPGLGLPFPPIRASSWEPGRPSNRRLTLQRPLARTSHSWFEFLRRTQLSYFERLSLRKGCIGPLSGSVYFISDTVPEAHRTAFSQVPQVATYRPIVPVRLDYQGRVWGVYAILDSGADQCLFPAFIVGLLGLNPQSARESTFQGVGSVNRVSTFFDDIGITVGAMPRFEGTIAFAPALNPSGYGLLGQGEFFSRYADTRLTLIYRIDSFISKTLRLLCKFSEHLLQSRCEQHLCRRGSSARRA